MIKSKLGYLSILMTTLSIGCVSVQTVDYHAWEQCNFLCDYTLDKVDACHNSTQFRCHCEDGSSYLIEGERQKRWYDDRKDDPHDHYNYRSLKSKTDPEGKLIPLDNEEYGLPPADSNY